MQEFRVMAVQMNAVKDDIFHNLNVHMQYIGEASDAGCKLVVFPELSVTTHYGEESVVRYAETMDGDIAGAMRAAARKHSITIGYGFCESAHGAYYNSHALVGPQGVVGVQRKVHASKDEYFCFRMGRSLEVFDLGFCKVGTLICYDSQFCEAWRVLALKGAEVILLHFLVHGTADMDVPYEWSRTLSEELTQAGVENALLFLPDAPHCPLAHMDQIIDRAAQFLHKYLTEVTE